MIVARALRYWAIATMRQIMVRGLFVAGCSGVLVGNVFGQIARDGSLGQTAGQLAGPSYTIGVQAAEQIRGSNLFHSFSEFNVNTGRTPPSVARAVLRTSLTESPVSPTPILTEPSIPEAPCQAPISFCSIRMGWWSAPMRASTSVVRFTSRPPTISA